MSPVQQAPFHDLRVRGWRITVARRFLDHARAHGFLDPPSLLRRPGGSALEESRTRWIGELWLRHPAPPCRLLLVIGRAPIPFTPGEAGTGESPDPALGGLPLLWTASRGRSRPAAIALELEPRHASLEEIVRDSEGGAGLRAEWATSLRAILRTGPGVPRLRAWGLYHAQRWAAAEVSPEPAGRRALVRELAALDASLPPGEAPVRERIRWLRGGLRDAGFPGGRDRRAFLREVVRRASDPPLRLRGVRASRSAFEVRPSGRGMLMIDRRYADLLDVADLGSLEAGLTHRRGERLRLLPDRENIRIAVSGYRTGPTVLYQKRYPGAPWLVRLRDRVAGRLARSRARWEWENSLQLRSIGIRTADPVALGERVRARRAASFVLTREIEGAAPLDDRVRERYSRAFPPVEARRWKGAMIESAARLARTLHRAGGFHKDLYLCHILVRETTSGHELFLIDLDRVRWGRRVRRRWFVKDVAALHVSAEPRFFTRADRMRFLLRYLGLGKLTPGAKDFARRVLRKGARMRAHTPRHRPGKSEAE